MAELSTTTAAAISVGTVSLVGTFLGMHYDALLLGLFGGLLMLARQQPASRFTAFSGVTLSSLLAGAISPVTSSIIVGYMSMISLEEARICSAAIVGCGWQSFAPVLLDNISELFKSLRNKVGLGD